MPRALEKFLAAPVVDSVDAAERDRQADEVRRKACVENFARSAGERYRGCSFKNFAARNAKQQSALDAARQWAATFEQHWASLVLFGPVGTGKDHLAFASVATVAVRYGLAAVWLNGREFFGEVRDRITDQLAERSLISRFSGPTLLVISDPLPVVGDLQSFQADMLYRVVESRWVAKKPTIVTINVAGDAEADQRIGAATWDRLNDGAWKIFCNWESHRKPAVRVNCQERTQ